MAFIFLQLYITRCVIFVDIIIIHVHNFSFVNEMKYFVKSFYEINVYNMHLEMAGENCTNQDDSD